MPAPSKPFTFSDTPPGTNLIKASEINANFDALFAALGLAAVADDQLASPNNAAWETVLTSQGTAAAAGVISGGVYYYSSTSATLSGGAGSTTVQGLWVPPAAADVAVAGKTTRLRLRVAYLANATAPGITMTWGLYPVSSVAGGNNTVIPTLGTVVAGSTAAVAPSAGAANHVDSANFDASLVTAGSAYVIGLATPGNMAANSLVSSQFFLEMRRT